MDTKDDGDFKVKIPDDYEGFTYKSRYGNNIIILGDNGLKGNKKKLIYFCETCSQDKDLWGEVLTTPKHILEEGKTGCACSGSPRWTEAQYKIKVERKCLELKLSFLGWAEPYKGVFTTVKLCNPKTNNEWIGPTISSFIRRGSLDPIFRRDCKYAGDNHHIQKFKSLCPDFSDKELLRNDITKDWFILCKTCLISESTKVGKNPYAFKISRSALNNGQNPCRCNKYNNRTKNEIEFKLKQIFRGNGDTFLGFENEQDFSASHTVLWKCEKCAALNKSTIHSVISEIYGCGCETGLFKERLLDKDYLYIAEIPNDIIKVGRSFNPFSRINGFKGKIIHLFEGMHTDVFKLERDIHRGLKRISIPQHNFSGYTECYHIKDLPLIFKYTKTAHVESV